MFAAAAALSTPMPHAGLATYEPETQGSREIAVEDLSIRCLRKAYEIRELAPLRRQIDLKAAASADPQFAAREKKETNWAGSSVSSLKAS